MKRQLSQLPAWIQIGARVWVGTKDLTNMEIQSYYPGIIISFDPENKFISVKNEKNNKQEIVDINFILERNQDSKIVNNLQELDILNDAELLHNIHLRYQQNKIHCYCGPTLLVVNPFQKLQHEESDEVFSTITQALNDKKLKNAPPHIWTISAISWDYLLSTEVNQAVCISGESGSGKTECTKRCLEFIAQIKGESRSLNIIPIEQKILSSNPLLECFGNAKTVRNDNSSRFGKYTTLYIDKGTKLVRGANIQNYLLEKSRVTNLSPNERNFHIFYVMLKNMNKKQLQQYFLLDEFDSAKSQKFNYLNQGGDDEVESINDVFFYEEVQNSLKDLDFSNSQKDALWKTLAIVLLMGNLEINESVYVEGQQACKIKRNKYWENLLSLLQIEEKVFEKALTHKQIIVTKTETYSPLTPSRVKNAIDSLAREIYNQLFQWLCDKLNSTLQPKDHNNQKYITIGVLDIFGFEILQKNSLEQLLINYANERLQGLFIDYVFKNECQLFEEEGLSEHTKLIVYTDNENLIKFIDNGKNIPGIFDLLDQTCLMNKTEDLMISDIHKLHKNTPFIYFNSISQSKSFIIKHTARDVEYEINEFVEKNKDELQPFLRKAFLTADQSLIKIFDHSLQIQSNSQKINTEKKFNVKEKYLDQKFKSNMDGLIQTLSQCYCHFVRCIKPNELKSANNWNSSLCLKQIRYMGLLDALKVRKHSFPFRFTFQKFYSLYQDIDQSEKSSQRFTILIQQQENFQQLSKGLLKTCGLNYTENDILFGIKKIFISDNYKNKLDKLLYEKQKIKMANINIIQQLFKSFLHKRRTSEIITQTFTGIQASQKLLNLLQFKTKQFMFRKYLNIIQNLQDKFRFKQLKKQMINKNENMKTIINYISLYKLKTYFIITLKHKRVVELLQSKINTQIKQQQQNICQYQIKYIFNKTWGKLRKNMKDYYAVDIQKLSRSFFLRQSQKSKQVQLMIIMQNAPQQLSAILIQKIVRGYIQRQKFLKIKQAVKTIQSHFKAKWFRIYFLKIRRSVKIIQTFLKKKNNLIKIKEKQLQIFESQHKKKVNKIIKFEATSLMNNKLILDDVPKIIIKDIQFQQFQKYFQYNYQKFIPLVKEKETQENVKLFSILIDVKANIDTLDIYPLSWCREFSGFLKKIQLKNDRFVFLDIGNDFTIAVTDNKNIYCWGLNDKNQCGFQSKANNFYTQYTENKQLSNIITKFISAGDNQTCIVDTNDNFYIFGNLNTDKQNSDFIYNLKFIGDKINDIVSKNNEVYIVTENGNLHNWEISDLKIQGIQQFMQVPLQHKIKQIDMGETFVLLLEQKGYLFSKGQNLNGELGLGDYEPRSDFEQLTLLSNENEFAIQIACGSQHAVISTKSGKIFCWGNNSYNQLSSSDEKAFPNPINYNIPNYTSSRCKPRSISAGSFSIFILLENKQLFFSGYIGNNISKQSKFLTRFQYEELFFPSTSSDKFVPIKIQTKWSRSLSATYIVFADLRTEKNKISEPKFKEAFIDNINANWANQRQILPFQNNIISRILHHKSVIKKPIDHSVSKQFKQNLQQFDAASIQKTTDQYKSRCCQSFILQKDAHFSTIYQNYPLSLKKILSIDEIQNNDPIKNKQHKFTLQNNPRTKVRQLLKDKKKDDIIQKASQNFKKY